MSDHDPGLVCSTSWLPTSPSTPPTINAKVTIAIAIAPADGKTSGEQGYPRSRSFAVCKATSLIQRAGDESP